MKMDACPAQLLSKAENPIARSSPFFTAQFSSHHESLFLVESKLLEISLKYSKKSSKQEDTLEFTRMNAILMKLIRVLKPKELFEVVRDLRSVSKERISKLYVTKQGV